MRSVRVGTHVFFVLVAALTGPSAFAATLTSSGSVDYELEYPFEPKGPEPVAGLSPTRVLVWSSEDATRRGYRTLGDLLADIPGVTRAREPLQDRYAFRGVIGGFGLVVDDVLVASEAERDRVDLDDSIDLRDVDRIEITPGPAYALAGDSALSGVIRVVTKACQAERASGAVNVAHTGARDLSAALGFWGSQACGRVFFRHRSGLSPPVDLLRIPLGFVRTGPLVLPGAKTDRTLSIQDRMSNTGRFSWSSGAFHGDVALGWHNDEVPIARFSLGLLGAEDCERIDIDRQRARIIHELEATNVRLVSMVSLARTYTKDHSFLFPKGGAFLTGGTITTQSEFWSVGLLERGDIALDRDHRLVFSGRGTWTRQHARTDAMDPVRDSLHADLVRFDDDALSAQLALEYQGDLGAGWHVTAGALLAWQTGIHVALAPRVGIFFVPDPRATLHMSYSEGIRAPDAYDLGVLVQGIVDGKVVGVATTDGLLPERVRTAELGAAVAIVPDLRLSAQVFVSRHDDALVDEHQGDKLVRLNAPKRHVVGGEADATASMFHSALKASVGVAVAHDLDRKTADGAKSLALYGRLVLRPFDSTELAVRTRAVLAGPATVATPQNDGRLPVFVDLALTQALFDDHLALVLLVTNLADAREVTKLVPAFSGSTPLTLLGPSRVLSLGIEASW